MVRLIATLILITLLAGCGTNTGSQAPQTPVAQETATPLAPTPIPPIDPTLAAALEAQLSAAEQQWHASDIASYRITVLEVRSIWSAQRMTVTVTDGHVSDIKSMCIPAPAQGRACTIKPVEPSNYLVPMLLEQARELLAERRPEHIQLVFDPILGYPTNIGFNDPQILDEDYGLKVEGFERLPGRPASELGETIILRLGETAQAGELTVTFTGIVNDSRCPTNVDCAEAGQVSAELTAVAPNSAPETLRLTLRGTGLKLEEPVLIAEIWQLQLVSVTPYPTMPGDIQDQEYRVTVQVSKTT